MILVTGAGGKTGKAVIQALIVQDEPVRAFAYREEADQDLIDLGVQEIVHGDTREKSHVEEAMKDIQSVYFIAPNMNPDEVMIGETGIAVAKAQGVDRFVYHSVLHPQIQAMPHHWNKLQVEEKLIESGLDFTILQPAAYMQNILVQKDTIQNEGVYRVPYPVETRLSMIDLSDLGEVARIVLTESGHQSAVYELVGEANISQVEVAEHIEHVIVRSVKVEETSLDAWEVHARANGLSQYALETLLKMFTHYRDHGFSGNAHALRWLLGREPISFAAFAQREWG